MNDYFTSRSVYADAVLVVEGRELYTSRYLLADVSPVFKKLFTETTRLELDGKQFTAVYDFLSWITPSVSKPVEDDNVESLLVLAHEFAVTGLKSECEQYFVQQYECNASDSKQLRALLLSKNYGLPKVYDNAVNYFANIKYQKLNDVEGIKDLPAEISSDIFSRRLQQSESNSMSTKIVSSIVSILITRLLLPALLVLICSLCVTVLTQDLITSYIADYLPRPDQTVPCPDNFTFSKELQTCFRFVDDDQQTWVSAREECLAMGADLVTIPNSKTQRFLATTAEERRGCRYGFWIGATDSRTEGDWRWVATGKKLQYANRLAKAGGDDLDCALMRRDRSWAWDDFPCNSRFCYICEASLLA